MKWVMCLVMVLLAGEVRAECTVIAGATVYLPGAKVGKVDVVLDGATIRELGPGAGCKRVDGSGKVLTAGFVDVYSDVGLVEIELEESTNETDLKNALTDPAGTVRAAVRASLAYDPRAFTVQMARTGGVTSALVVPHGGIISGGSFWVDLTGNTRSAIKLEPASMVANLGMTESRAAAMHIIDIALREAGLWAQQGPAYMANKRAPFANRTLDLEALGPVVTGRVPLMVEANRASDIEALLALTAGSKVRLVIVGAAEGWLVAKQLADRKVAVVVDPFVYGPGGFDQINARPDNAALLAKAGVVVMLSTFDTHQVRKLRQVAGNAVRGGMRWEDALLSVTEWPAQTLGLPTHGRVAAGAIGNVVLWSGDPFELSTEVVGVWIDGQAIDLRTRQTELFERWRTLP